MWIRELGKLKSAFLQRRGLEPRRDIRGATNGEFDLLRYVAALPEISGRDCVIDVGANVGDWTSEALNRFASAGISTFLCVEPIPAYAAKLRARFADQQSVHVYEMCLSDQPSPPINMYQVGEKEGRIYGSYRDSILPPDSSKQYTTRLVDVTTGDALFEGRRPCFLKIDCEGHDLHVLRGFQSLLQQARPVVQLEYCEFWIASNARLKETCQFLHHNGYTPYKLFPDSLRKLTYSWLHETFAYQNIVAIADEFQSSRSETIPFRGAGDQLPR
ncbi:MAG: FkbM family methyltransferase [Bradyrhizobiaceae bacterium]|nr:FkbM family methyltransferase [Bradyrhizobiaceae bacterium]